MGLTGWVRRMLADVGKSTFRLGEIGVDFLLENWMLVLTAIMSAVMLFWPGLANAPKGSDINVQQAVQMINKEKAVVVDVCSPAEHAAGHVAGAHNVPLDQLDKNLGVYAKDKSMPVIMVCASGMRSNRAVMLARKQGYEKVFTLKGGMSAWRSANLPVKRGA